MRRIGSLLPRRRRKVHFAVWRVVDDQGRAEVDGGLKPACDSRAKTMTLINTKVTCPTCRRKLRQRATREIL